MGRRERTEAGWLACTYPGSMLPHVLTRSARKLRLFAVACCRRVWNLLPDARSRRAVEAAELWADGLLGRKELRAAHEAANRVPLRSGGRIAWAPRAAARAALPRKDQVSLTAAFARWAVEGTRTRQEEERYQCDLLRDVFGYPFRAVAFDPAWLAWQGGAVVQVAQAIYNENRFQDLPVLADALEDAGCDNAEVLAHCRGGGIHVRGCFVVDLLLDRS
jgi:hypothetical protein